MTETAILAAAILASRRQLPALLRQPAVSKRGPDSVAKVR